MNIAQQIKVANTISTENGDILCVNSIMVEAESLAVDVNNDWDYELTTYIFADLSVLCVSGNEVNVYGANS